MKIFVRVEPVNPTRATPRHPCKFVVNGIKLVVIDIAGPPLWRVADVKMMRSAVTAAILPSRLVPARDSGACVLLIHHASEIRGQLRRRRSGQGALFATVDVALTLKTPLKSRTQRKLIGISRYADTPAELIRRTSRLWICCASAIRQT